MKFKIIINIFFIFWSTNLFSLELDDYVSNLDNDGIVRLNETLRKIKSEINSIDGNLNSLIPNEYISGMDIEYVDDDTVNVTPGQCKINGQFYSVTENMVVDMSGSSTNQFHYIYMYVTSDGIIQVTVLPNTPVYSDTNNNTDGVLRYYEANGDYYRCIGAIYKSSVVDKFYANKNYIQFDNSVVIASSSSTDVQCRMPVISKCGYFLLYTSGNTVQDAHISVRPNGSSHDIFECQQGYGRQNYSYCKIISTNQLIDVYMNGSGTEEVYQIGYWIER